MSIAPRYEAVSTTNEDSLNVSSTLKSPLARVQQSLTHESSSHPSLSDNKRADGFHTPGQTPRRSPILSWWPEILAWACGVAIVAAIAAILQAFNNTAVLAWTFPINLNALLSLLATLLLMALRMQIPKCISQLKWNHFVKSRTLMDIELFDQASRSVWGSGTFLVKKPKRVLGSLGAFLTISIIAVGPLIQQLISQQVNPQLRTSDRGAPFLPILNWTSPVSTKNLTDNPTGISDDNNVERQLELTDAIRSGLIPKSAQDFLVTPSCVNNANCTWDPFWTLAVESECNNVTDQAEITWDTIDAYIDVSTIPNWFSTWDASKPVIRNVSLPNGLVLSNLFMDHVLEKGEVNGDMDNYSISAYYPSLNFADRGLVILDFFFLGAEIGFETYDSAYFAYECILQLRAQNYQAETTNGIFTETQLGPSIQNNTREGKLFSPWIMSGLPLEPPDESFNRLLNEDPYFAIEIDSQNDTKLWLPAKTLEEMPRNIIQSMELDYQTEGFVKDNQETVLMRLMPLLSTTKTYLRAAGTNITFEERIENIAKSLTQTLRSSYFTNTVNVEGDARTNTIVYVVTWEWIILPASLVILALVLLVSTVVDTYRKGLQKRTDSALALIALGRDDATRRILEEANGDLDAALEIAEQYTVRIDKRHRLISTL
ncbi:hypothetical protein HII31_08941 [Pseudocercospora fuligena]|uniref:Uncharacterized protein n=1 Tax=Pseudocercospora fuligena TaxID=685502 RepID=A0A8H6RDY7_9PEZI|nr:hypothetical protein HII31_08941 [Pseudocercospora fuligena]